MERKMNPPAQKRVALSAAPEAAAVSSLKLPGPPPPTITYNVPSSQAKPTTNLEKVEVPEVIVDCSKKIAYQRGRFLGKGGFAKCYEVLHPTTDKLLACKVVNKGLLTKSHQREKMAQEITIHRDLKHDHVVEFYSYFEDDNNVYIVLELCGKKSLMEMQKRRKVISEPEARYFLRQLTVALIYLHEDKRIIHRDLKLGNIFINDDMELKIGDFGLATHIEFDGERKKTLCGTPNYIAPEVLAKRGHSFEVDIWSLGCILYTFLLGKPPFETTSLQDTYRKIRKGEFKLPASRVSNAARNLIVKMLQVEPNLRPTAKKILEHEFFTQNKLHSAVSNTTYSSSFIPTSLPVSCLTTAPRFEKQKPSPLPNVGTMGSSSSRRQPLAEFNPGSPQIAQPQSMKPPVQAAAGGGSEGDAPNRSMERGYEMSNSDIIELIQSLRNQLTATLSGKGVVIDVPTIDDESEDPSLAPMLWISKWVDYSDKYGFGYQLNDDSIGVSFNDQTKVILLPDLNQMHYIERSGKESYYSVEAYPPELQKKVKLLNYFKQYMKENLLKFGGKAPSSNTCIARLPNLWTWFRTSRAVVMILSNGTVQINNFRDHTKMILCPLLGAVSTIEPNRSMQTYKLAALQDNGCSEALASRLKYAFEKCNIVIGSQETQLLNQNNNMN